MPGGAQPRGVGAAAPKEAILARIGERFEIEIEGLAAGGDGVGRHGGLVVFVEQAAPGDRLEVEVVEAFARHLRTRVRRVLQAGPGRLEPPCPVFGRCGGCAWQHLDYPVQLEWKRTIVVEALRRLGHVADPERLVAPVLAAQPPWRYRHKMAVPFAPPRQRGGPLQAGFFAVRSHRIVDLATCAIQHPLLDRALAETRRLADALGVQAYDERSRRGDLRHLVGRVSHSQDTLLLALVTAGPGFAAGPELARGLREALPQCVGVVQNIQGAPGNAILGERTRPLAGADHLVEEIDGLRFLVSAPSFFQVSPVQAAALYREAIGQAGLARGDTVFDLYAGVGTLSLFLARTAATVHAVEEVEAAVADGRRNAQANGMRNLRFHAGTAEAVVPTLVSRDAGPDVVVLDPPRKGASAPVLQAVAAARPRRVVYVSCNPATLARDIGLLAEAGYGLLEVRPVDMFPQTAHVECCAVLRRDGGA